MELKPILAAFVISKEIARRLVLGVLLAAASTLNAQTDGRNARYVNGVPYYPQTDDKWRTIEGELWSRVPEGMILREVTNPGRYVPPDVNESQSIGAYSGVTGSTVGRKYGKSFLVLNYHGKIAERGQRIKCLAMRVGTRVIGEQKMEAWDCGTSEVRGAEPAGPLPESWKPRVKAVLDLAGDSLRVKNASGENWPDLNLVLVAADGTEFTNSVPALNGGKMIEIPLTNFVNQAGEHAKPDGKFKKAAIGGNGFQLGAYRL